MRIEQPTFPREKFEKNFNFHEILILLDNKCSFPDKPLIPSSEVVPMESTSTIGGDPI